MQLHKNTAQYILVCVILNGDRGLTGCAPHGYSLLSVSTGQSIIAVCF